MKIRASFVIIVLAMSCSADTRSDDAGPDLAAIQARCQQDVAGRCQDTLGREQLECVKSELRSCLEEAAAAE